MSNTANEPAATEANKKQLVRLASALAVFWLFASGMGLWYFFNRDITSFIPSGANEQPYDAKAYESQLKTIIWPKSDGLTFIHYIDDACSCTRFSLAHIEDLKAAYSENQHIVVRSSASDSIYQLAAMSSPSVAVISKSGQLAYYGPYTDGATCQQGDDLVEVVVQNLERDETFEWLNLLSSGCFCAWPKNEDPK